MTWIEFIWWIATPTCECFLKMGGPISTLLTSILITFDSFDSMHTLLSYCVFPYSKWPLQYFIYLLSYAIVMALTSKISLIFVQKTAVFTICFAHRKKWRIFRFLHKKWTNIGFHLWLIQLLLWWPL